MINDFKKEDMSTLTHRIAAIQVKMLHLQFRRIKICKDQELIVKNNNSNITSRESLKQNFGTIYNTIDKIISFEHLYQLINDIFATPELKNKFDKNLTEILGNARKTALKWISVRNKLGGHIDLEIAENFCKQNNYFGVFLSDDLEADVGVLNILLIVSAVNEARNKSDIFGRDLDLKKNGISGEMKIFAETLNKNWDFAFSYFVPMTEFLYKYGKEEKMLSSIPSEKSGIVVD